MTLDAVLKSQELAQSKFEFECKACKSDNVNFQRNGKAVCQECKHAWRWEPVQIRISTPVLTEQPPARPPRPAARPAARPALEDSNEETKKAKDKTMNQRVRAWLDQVEPDDEPLEQPWQDFQQEQLVLPKRRKRVDDMTATEPAVVDGEGSTKVNRIASQGSSASDRSTLKSVARATSSAIKAPSSTVSVIRAQSSTVSVHRAPSSTISVTRAPPSSTVLVNRAPPSSRLVTRASSTQSKVTRASPSLVKATRASPSVVKVPRASPNIVEATRPAPRTPLAIKTQEIRPSLEIPKDDIPTSILTTLQPNIHRYPPTHPPHQKNPSHAPRTSSPLTGRRSSQPPRDENNDNDASSLAELARRHRQQKAAMLLRCASLHTSDL